MALPQISVKVDERVTGMTPEEALALQARQLAKQTTEGFDRVGKYLTDSEGSSLVCDALPTAEIVYQGKLATLRKLGVSRDELHVCLQDTGGGFVWVKIV